MEVENSGNYENFCDFSVEKLNEFCNRKVRLTTEDKKSQDGWIFSIDPITKSIVFISDSSPNLVKIFFGTSIENLQILPDAQILPENVKKILAKIAANSKIQTPESELAPEALKERKEKVKNWLIKNRIPISENGGNSSAGNSETGGNSSTGNSIIFVLNALEIRPPYSIDDCFSANDIVLARVRKLLEAMPTN